MFSILKSADIRVATHCKHDNQNGYSVVWDENDNFKQYQDLSGASSAVVWEGVYTAVSMSGTCSVGPIADQSPINTGFYNTVKVKYRVDIGENVIVPTKGRIQFQTQSDTTYSVANQVDFDIQADNGYHEYSIDMSTKKEWVGNVVRIKIYPFIDGANVGGTLFHLKYLKVESDNNFSCDTIYNGSLCNRYNEYVHPCPWVGVGGSANAQTEVSDVVSIQKDVNDELIIDINSYGEQRIKLKPASSTRLIDIAREIEEKLSVISVGGFFGAKVEVVNDRIRIIADDTREASSTVIVKDNALARLLGFYSNTGEITAEFLPGEDSATRYEPASSISLPKSEISKLYRDDIDFSSTGVLVSNKGYSVQAGRKDYFLVYKDKKIDFIGKTIIDFNNPVNNTGTITKIFYSGDGTVNTEFRIFRPRFDGTLDFVSSTPFNLTASNLIDKIFELDVSIRVRKGDFIALYDGRLDAGKDEELPNASYFIHNGNLLSSISTPQYFGRGERGLRIFARSNTLADEVILDVRFDQPQQIEEIYAYAEEDERVDIINLSHVSSGGPNGGPYITGETGLDKFGNQAPPLTSLAALTDNVRQDTNGPSPALHPSWLDSFYEPADRYDQTSFSVILDFAKGLPVFFNIYKVILYFRSDNNVKYFSLQYPITTDEEDVDRYWGFVADKYDRVSLEGKFLYPNTHPLYFDPIKPTAAEFLDSYQFLKYRTLDIEFPAVKARSIKYEVKNYALVSDVSSSSYSLFSLSPNPYILEMEVFALSRPLSAISDNFYFESSNNGDNYYLHTKVKTLGKTSASYLIGYPVRYLRIHIKPDSPITVIGFKPTLSETDNLVISNLKNDYLQLNIPFDNTTSYETFEIINDTEDISNYYIDIVNQRTLSDRCILWNKLSSDEEISKSLIGASPMVRKRPPASLREYNYAYLAPGYISDPNWLFDKVSYITYDSGNTFEALGTLLTDYDSESYITTETNLGVANQTAFILIDLGDTYALDTVQIITPSPYKPFFNVSYSNKNVSNPQDLNIIEDFFGTKIEARWIRLSGFIRELGHIQSDVYAMSFIRISLDCFNRLNHRKIPWVPAPNLTNYITKSIDESNSCAEGWQCIITGFNNYYAVDLDGKYNITNVIVGPNSSLSETSNVDNIEPGDPGSLFTETNKKNVNLAFSADNYDDPNRVSWTNNNVSPSGGDRWLLLKSTIIADEVIVHVDDNVQENKLPPHQPRWWSSNFSNIYRDFENFRSGNSSIAIEYPANKGPQLEEVILKQSLGIDHFLGKRDVLLIQFYISDVSQIDLTEGSFSIGRNVNELNKGAGPAPIQEIDENNYYQWNFSALGGLPFRSGWNELLLPFTDFFKIGEPYFTKDNTLGMAASATSGKSRFTWFKISFKGVPNNKSFRVNVGGFDVQRTKFTGSKFGDALYLTSDEYALFELDSFDPLKGSIEFWLNPDWSKMPGCNNCQSNNDHTVFRFYNSDGYVFGCFMTGKGLRFYLSDGIKHYYLTDSTILEIQAFNDVHIGVNWDLLGEFSNNAIEFYINGNLSSIFEVEGLFEGQFISNPNASLILGGLAWDGAVNNRCTAVDGTIQHLKVYNYPIRDFSSGIQSEDLLEKDVSSSLIEISLDGVNFYGMEDRGKGIPLYKPSVSPNGKFNIHIKNKLGANRETSISYIEITRARNNGV